MVVNPPRRASARSLRKRVVLGKTSGRCGSSVDLLVTRLVVIPAQVGIHVSNWPLDLVLIGVIAIYLIANDHPRYTLAH